MHDYLREQQVDHDKLNELCIRIFTSLQTGFIRAKGDIKGITLGDLINAATSNGDTYDTYVRCEMGLEHECITVHTLDHLVARLGARTDKRLRLEPHETRIDLDGIVTPSEEEWETLNQVRGERTSKPILPGK